MRTAQPAQRARAPVTVWIAVDGRTTQHVFPAKGFKSDGFSVGELRVPLTPGRHQVSVSVATHPAVQAARQEWATAVNARPGRATVLTLEAGGGFQFEP